MKVIRAMKAMKSEAKPKPVSNIHSFMFNLPLQVTLRLADEAPSRQGRAAALPVPPPPVHTASAARFTVTRKRLTKL